MADEWLAEAVCVGTSPRVFFDDVWPEERGYNLNVEALHKARWICNGCPVRRECLIAAIGYEDGLSVKSRSGVWGGLTPAQRRSLDVRRADLHCVCGAPWDPLLWLSGELSCSECGARATRPAVPDEGDQWDDRHTDLAERAIHLIGLVGVGEVVPAPKETAQRWNEPIAEVRRVYSELVLTGVLTLELAGKRKVYKRRADTLDDWRPTHKQEAC